MQRCSGRIALLALWVAALICVDHALAQSTSSVADTGLQILQGLSSDQRNAIMQQLGGGLGGSGTGGTQGNAGNRREPSSELEEGLMLQQQRQGLAEQKKERAELERLSPFLRGDDWIVITIDSNPLPPINPAGTGVQQGELNALASLQQQAATGTVPQIPGLTAGSTSQPGSGGGSAAAAAAQQASTANQSSTQGITAGGYLPPPPPCTGDPNCDESQQRMQRPPELTEEQKKQRQMLIDLIRSKNPYQLSHDGTLSLPGFAPIHLAGLTEQLATLRLGVEPALRDLYIRVTKLPLIKEGTTALKPFGYELFDNQVSTFAPATNVPVPASYVVGPGDELDLQIYGTKNASIKLVVGRDGVVNVPELGPVNVEGRTFDGARSLLESRVERQMRGVRASVTMGDTRTIRVFVLGDARYPGSYTISGLGTITSALFAAGGIETIGSLRNIQLKRNGQLVRRLDLYDMLIRGDTTDDARLLPGDVVFVPPVGATISVDGEVRRPAIYEIHNESSIADVVQLAGGLTAEADTAKVALTRIDAAEHRVVLHVDLSAAAGRSETVRDGDVLRVSRLRPTLDAGVLVQGYVYTSGAFAFRPGMRLTDVLQSVDDLKPGADLHYVLIRRELPPDRRIEVRSADLAAALRAPGSDADVPLMPRDRITVFDLQSSRDRVVHPLLEDLKLQSNIGVPDDVVRIEGSANVPGEYPLEAGMTVRDLIRAGGGLSDSAYAGNGELTRYEVVDGEMRRTQVLDVDLTAALRGDPAANLRLEPFDTLSIKQVESWTEQGSISLRGEVKFPGVYSIKPGETLKSVLMRAGGLTRYAFPQGGVFTRVELREREQKELDMLARRMQSDITFVALEGSVANQSSAVAAVSVGQSLLAQLRAAKAVGRLVIDLPRIMRSPVGSPYDVILRDGDELRVPKFRQEISVIGEVQSATSHLYRAGLTRDDYIAMSGGYTVRADKGRIYVVRADGSVVHGGGHGWFRNSAATQIEPGDTIVVPLNAEHMPPLPLWQAVTQILYNVAIAILAVRQL